MTRPPPPPPPSPDFDVNVDLREGQLPWWVTLTVMLAVISVVAWLVWQGYR